MWPGRNNCHLLFSSLFQNVWASWISCLLIQLFSDCNVNDCSEWLKANKSWERNPWFKRMLLKVLWMALIAGLIGNDETLASYKKKHWTYQIQDQSAKTILSLRPKWPKSYSISDENVLRLVYNQGYPISNKNQMSLSSRKAYDKLITMTAKKVGCPC